MLSIQHVSLKDLRIKNDELSKKYKDLRRKSNQLYLIRTRVKENAIIDRMNTVYSKKFEESYLQLVETDLNRLFKELPQNEDYYAYKVKFFDEEIIRRKDLLALTVESLIELGVTKDIHKQKIINCVEKLFFEKEEKKVLPEGKKIKDN